MIDLLDVDRVRTAERMAGSEGVVEAFTTRHPSLVTPPLALYVHIPFCVRKCFYCDFNSGPAGEEARSAYVDSLCREIAQSPWAGQEARTVFFGGGTPSELTVKQLGRITG